MTTKNRKDLANIIAGIYVIVALSVYFFVAESTSFYWYIGIAFSFIIVEKLVYYILPAKKTQKTSRKKQSKKSTSKDVAPNRLRDDATIIKSSIEDLSWREFERICFLYFKAKGYKPKETSEGADGGVDLIIYNPTDRTEEAVQIKHYIHSGKQITVKEIRELDGAKKNYKCTLTRFITTSGYTTEAMAQADRYHMECHMP